MNKKENKDNLSRYAQFKQTMANYNEDMDLNYLQELIGEMEDVLQKHPADYETIKAECERLKRLQKKLRSGALCPRCGHHLYLSDMKRSPNAHVCVHCDDTFSDRELEKNAE